MNTEKIKYVEIDGRKFQISKFDAKTSLKVSKILIAKILPMIDTFLPALLDSGTIMSAAGGIGANLNDADTMSEMLSAISLERVAHALDIIDEKDLERIINFSLSHCYELLSAGPVQVLSLAGMYGVSGVEDDMLLMLRLTIEAVAWSVGGFFDASRWTSMFKPLAASFKQSASTSTNSSLRPL